MEYIEVMKQIVILAFEKAKKECLREFKTPLSRHMSNKMGDDYNIYISDKTFTRYYDKFIGGQDDATGTPNRKIVDALCQYIGFDNFIDFYYKNEEK